METPSSKPILGVWSMDTVYELLNDMLCFEFMRSIMVRMKNHEAKAYVSAFLKFYAPVFVHELVGALDKLGIVPKSEQCSLDVQNFIKTERQRALKDVIANSTRAPNAVKEMGLDFSQEVYDINVIVHDKTLLDTNFGTYTDPLENIDLWNKLFATPKGLLSVFAKAFSERNSALDLHAIWQAIEDELDTYAHRADEALSCKRYSYSSCRLFKSAPELTLNDRIFILYRFCLISSASIVPNIIPSLLLKLGEESIVDTARFFRKYRALVIEILRPEYKALSTPFTDKILADLETDVTEKSFFSLNRSIRNNVHYETTNVLSDEQITIVDRYQSVYLDTVMKHFMSCMTIDIDKQCLSVTAYFNACMDKGMSKEDVSRHALLRYIVYRLTGKLIK